MCQDLESHLNLSDNNRLIVHCSNLHNGDLHNIVIYHLHDQIRQNEIGRTCSTYWYKKNAYMSSLRKPEEETTWEGLGIDGTKILKCVLKKTGKEGMDWFNLVYH